MTTPFTRGRTPPVATGASGGAGRDLTSRPVAVGNPQRLVIENWLPEQLANSNLDWRIRQERLQSAKLRVWAAAKRTGLEPLVGRVRLTVLLVFPQNRRRDTDNLYARVKGVVDGLVKGGWLVDDSTEWLELEVKAEVRPGVKQTEITLESLP